MADLKLDTLIKILLMTTSDTDGEALAALRAANKMLKAAHTDWDKLLRGKVTVVADPFSNIPPPSTTKHTSVSPHAPTPPNTTRHTPPPPHTVYTTPQNTRRPPATNTFPGRCFYCDIHVPAAMGALRHISVSHGTKIFCEDCNMNLSTGKLTTQDIIDMWTFRQRRAATQPAPKPTPQPRPKRKVTTADLMKDIDF